MNEYPELYNESYVLYDHVMNPFAAQLERKTRRDRGTRRGCPSTSSSTFDQPSSSHLNDDDDDDGNDKGTSRASTPSLIRYVNSLTNQVPQVFQNPPNIDPHLEPFYTRQTEIINRQVHLRDEQRGRVRSRLRRRRHSLVVDTRACLYCLRWLCLCLLGWEYYADIHACLDGSIARLC
ncbi:hypothetical protein Tco_0908664 [Tanacetum coccineum]|uniref:Uncharacterized protein n=1 Tax=Tanacetum coccineum TaxID=301880 RepID=A0ABQ5CUA9_9ASTR